MFLRSSVQFYSNHFFKNRFGSLLLIYVNDTYSTVFLYQKELERLRAENAELSKKLAKSTRAYQVGCSQQCTTVLYKYSLGSEGAVGYLQERGSTQQRRIAKIATATTSGK